MQLNMDLSNANPTQTESAFANVPLPSAHLVVITEDEMKVSKDQTTGFEKGENLILHCEILHSSSGNEFVGQKLGLYVTMSGNETAIKIGQRRLSTLAHTLGLGNYLTNSEQLHGQAFIALLDKDKDNNFPQWKKILRQDGLEIADASGNFKECDVKSPQLQAELHKLLETMKGGANGQVQQNNAPVGGFGAPNQTQAPNFGGQTANAPQNFVPNNGQAPNFGAGAVGQNTVQANVGFGNNPPQTQQVQQAQPNFGQAQQAPNFGGAPAGNWGAQINPNNGQ